MSLYLSALFVVTSITGGLFPVHSDTFAQAQSPQSTINGQITLPLDVADSIYNENTTKFLGSKNISLTPYRMTEEHSSDQGFLKGVGNVTNNQTYISTHLSDELIQSRGNGTFETPDGQSIDWISSSIGRPVDGRWVFHGIILFNNTQSESLSLLNNSIGLSKNIIGNEPDYIWLLE
ncbi:MAG TPA: hypothetical protein VJ799_07145 [Nitrososphaeraceae archaeon]|nr:hypothetical protein [Nitrososphaeraceae archaeon]